MFHVKLLVNLIKSSAILALLSSCATSIFYKKTKNGDFIFVEAKQQNLSGAISRVTNTNQKTSYDHIGIVEVNGGKKYFLHAAPENGSEKILLKHFIKTNKKDHRIQDLFRLKKQYQSCIPQAIVSANRMLGKPYNTTYVLNENEYYCSDFVERAFRNCKIFVLKPMTFTNPKTGKTDNYWNDFYKNLNMEVPEGKPGCNPNGLSLSDKIEKITTLKP